MLLKGGRDSRFSRRGESGKPDCEATLLAEVIALGAREGGVPCDVAVVGALADIIGVIVSAGRTIRTLPW